MRNSITSKNVLLPPWLADFLDFSPSPAERITHPLVLFPSPSICSFFLYPFWGTLASPQACCRTGQHIPAPMLTPVPSPLLVCTGLIPFSMGQGNEWVRWACSECVWWEPMCQACVRVPALLTETCHIPRRPLSSCVSVSTRQEHQPKRLRLHIPASLLRPSMC